ncbi:hypothetical protein RJ639_037068, partial [Escallonia herrerae]
MDIKVYLHPEPDSTDENFTESLQDLANVVNSEKLPNGFCQIGQTESTRRVFIQEPTWITSLFVRNVYRRNQQRVKTEFKEIERRNYYLLRRRQIKAETEAWEKMTDEYRELEREMCEKKLAPNLPYVKKLFLGWFEPLREAIAKEQKTQRTKKQKAAYAPHIDCLPADKMAVIVMHKMMGLLMMGQEDRYVRVVQAAVQIGVAIEQEVRIHGILEITKFQRKKVDDQAQEDMSKEAEILKRRVRSLIKRKRLIEVQKLVKIEEIKSWGRDTRAKLGCRLIELLTETAYVQLPVDQSADSPPDIRPAFWHIFKIITKDPGQSTGKRYGVIECDSLVLAGLERNAKHMIIPYVPMLVPPRKWKGYDKGGHFFLPSYLMRTHGSRQQQDAVKSALNTLGHTKWRVNRRVLSVVERIWSGGGNIAGLVDRVDVPIPELHSEDLKEIKKWRWSVRKAKKINQERHSQRCDIELKLSVAWRMKDEDCFYYPHNLDFRGRAYPMHPHLNHLSSDLCRGILEFAEGRPLGKSGLSWLKIHLANLYAGGVEKLSYDGRLAVVDNHLDDILDSADNPLSADRWWLMAEDPFQCLAACINLAEALKSSSPHTVISHLPIHQLEATAVNLVAGDKPADVYSEIAASNLIVAFDISTNSHPLTADASKLFRKTFQVDRKLVKQTVTLAALREIFQAARGIMGWLGDCAKGCMTPSGHMHATLTIYVDEMNRILREKFVELYSMPILEN